MRLYAPDMDEFLGWMDSEGIRYAVLRNAPAFVNSWPARGGKDDVDMLVDDGALDRIGVYAVRHGLGRVVILTSNGSFGAGRRRPAPARGMRRTLTPCASMVVAKATG